MFYYEYLPELWRLVKERLVSVQWHPTLPLVLYNYTPRAQHLPLAQWEPALRDARGLILTTDGGVVAFPFRKFWNYEQVATQVPSENFTVWEKLDGSLGIVCSYDGERIVATRGSFVSEQARWAANWFNSNRTLQKFNPEESTYLFEIIYPENRIVVDYKGRAELVLLAVHDDMGADLWNIFDWEQRFTKARRFDGVRDFAAIVNEPQFAGEEGFVISYENGFRCKVKAAEYVRLHRLITQVSTRTIWELLRAGQGMAELVDRVPAEFAQWVQQESGKIQTAFETVQHNALTQWHNAPAGERKQFAEYAKQCQHPQLLFRLYDGKPIEEAVWKIVEPKWSTPFKQKEEE